MSNYLINKTINDMEISGLQVFYDFNSYSGGYINSIENGNSAYSGEVKNFTSNFSGQSSGSGFFNGEYIEIKNTDNITSENATIIFSQKKTGISNGVIFSHLDPNGPSGWELGVNEANKYYFKHFQDGTPAYYILDAYMSDQNLCAVSVSEMGMCEMYRLNFGKKEQPSFIEQFFNQEQQDEQTYYYDFDKEIFSIPRHTVSNGSTWNIGSGEFLYKGYIDHFLYFDVDLPADAIRRLANSIYAEGQMIDDVSGYASGQITGYLKSESGVSGKIGQSISAVSSNTQSGYYVYDSGVAQTGAASISGTVYVPYTNIEALSGTDQINQTLYRKVVNLSYYFNITGDTAESGLTDFESSGSYWHFSGNSGTYKGNSSVGPPNTIFGITGFDIVQVTGYKTGISVTGYQSEDASGVIYNEYSYTPLYSPDVPYLISGAYFSGNQNEPDPQYFPNAISLKGKMDASYFYEIIYDVYDGTKINNTNIPSYMDLYKKNIILLSHQATNEDLQIAINGISQTSGSIAYSKNQFNLPTFQVESGFFTTGSQVFTLDNLEFTDDIIYDISESGGRNNLTIDNLSDYLSRPFVSFDFQDKQVFFNGVKIYSGIDYVDDGGFFPSGNVTESTGIYFTYPNYSGAVSYTGSGTISHSIEHEEITPNGYLAFFNGVRQPPSTIVAHAKNSDLISGTIVNQTLETVYSMTNGLEGGMVL